MSWSNQLALGIDLGASKILAVLCTKSGDVIGEIKQPTRTNEGQAAVLGRIEKMGKQLLAACGQQPDRIVGVGLGFPGLVNSAKGLAYSTIMLPGWENVPLASILERIFDRPSVIDNDVNAAAWGEWWLGAGRGSGTMICLTIGTGIGGAIIFDGKLYRGPDGTAGEFGNTTIQYDGPQCACGNFGCLNPLASGAAIANRAIDEIKHGVQAPEVMALIDGDVNHITAEVLATAAKQSSTFAREIIIECARLLGVGIANFVNILNPDVIVLGGGVIQAGEFYLDAIRQEVKRRAFDIPAQRAKIVPAKLGQRAGAIGAAGLLFQSLKRS